MSIDEHTFGQLVTDLKSVPDAGSRLAELLDEQHPVYSARASSAVTRMRGWVLLALAEVGVTDRELVYVLEELDTGREAYLVAAAARALRSYAGPAAALRPHLERAHANIRFHDDALRLDRYGAAADAPPYTTATEELAATLAFVDARSEEVGEPAHACCCMPASRLDAAADPAVPPVVKFQDHDGATLDFGDFFIGHPSIVAFFYTRCTNPQKCSLTITKLAAVNDALRARGLDAAIRTAAITYDPQFDAADRICRYALSRGAKLDENHRVLRPIAGFEALRNYFGLGVNFIGSIVNRHRVELYVLDARGRIAASFLRVLWDETQVIEAAMRELQKPPDAGRPPPPASSPTPTNASTTASAALSSAFSVATAFFPKCAMCWYAYLSALGIAGLERIEYSPWLLPVLAVLMVANILLLYPRSGSRRGLLAFLIAAAGAFVILVPGFAFKLEFAPLVGVTLTIIGSLLSVGFRRKNANGGELASTSPCATTRPAGARTG
jgi:protein SCO1/2